MADSAEIDTHCPVCRETFTLKAHYPKLLPCNHTMCKSCIKELGSDFDCPVCRFHIESTNLIAISTNFVAMSAVENEDALNREEDYDEIEDLNAENYDSELTPTAEVCPMQGDLKESINKDKQLSSEEDLEDKLDLKFQEGFDETSDRIEKYEQVIQGLKTSKDETLEKIELDFEKMEQLLMRRKQLLRNQVLTQYEEKLEDIEENMEKVTFTTMCLSSLQKHAAVIFDEHTKSKEELCQKNLKEMDLKTQEEEMFNKLTGNYEKISFEINDLQEKLEDVDGIKDMELSFESSGQPDVCKCIKTLGRVKLKVCD